METITTEINGRKFNLELEPTVFEIRKERNTRGHHCVCFSWLRETQFKNIVVFTLLVFHLGPPWFFFGTDVLDRNETPEEV